MSTIEDRDCIGKLLKIMEEKGLDFCETGQEGQVVLTVVKGKLHLQCQLNEVTIKENKNPILTKLCNGCHRIHHGKIPLPYIKSEFINSPIFRLIHMYEKGSNLEFFKEKIFQDFYEKVKMPINWKFKNYNNKYDNKLGVTIDEFKNIIKNKELNFFTGRTQFYFDTNSVMSEMFDMTTFLDDFTVLAYYLLVKFGLLKNYHLNSFFDKIPFDLILTIKPEYMNEFGTFARKMMCFKQYQNFNEDEMILVIKNFSKGYVEKFKENPERYFNNRKNYNKFYCIIHKSFIFNFINFNTMVKQNSYFKSYKKLDFSYVKLNLESKSKRTATFFRHEDKKTHKTVDLGFVIDEKGNEDNQSFFNKIKIIDLKNKEVNSIAMKFNIANIIRDGYTRRNISRREISMHIIKRDYYIKDTKMTLIALYNSFLGLTLNTTSNNRQEFINAMTGKFLYNKKLKIFKKAFIHQKYSQKEIRDFLNFKRPEKAKKSKVQSSEPKVPFHTRTLIKKYYNTLFDETPISEDIVKFKAFIKKISEKYDEKVKKEKEEKDKEAKAKEDIENKRVKLSSIYFHDKPLTGRLMKKFIKMADDKGELTMDQYKSIKNYYLSIKE